MKTVSNVYLLGFLVTLCIIIIDSTAHSTFRTRPRSTRGFKNAALSTARGFGKRDGFNVPIDLPILKEIVPKDGMKNPIEKFPLVSVKESSKFPDLVKTLLKKLVDNKMDDELSSDELLQNIEY